MAERRRVVVLRSNPSKIFASERNGTRSPSQSSFERKFSSYLKSNRKEKSKEERLEMYWKNICQQESNSKDRNKALLNDFERVEEHAAMLSVKLNRLKVVRDQYEDYVNKMYPSWREELEHHRLVLQQERNGLYSDQVSHDIPRSSVDHPHQQDFLAAQPHWASNGHVRFHSPEPHFQRHRHEDMLPPSYGPYRGYTTTQTFNETSPSRYSDAPRGHTGGEWDPYYTRGPPMDYYGHGQVSSLRSPHGHVPHQPRDDLLRFSTPYHPAHSGPHDPRSGFHHSFDMSYSSPGFERLPSPGVHMMEYSRMHGGPEGRPGGRPEGGHGGPEGRPGGTEGMMNRAAGAEHQGSPVENNVKTVLRGTVNSEAVQPTETAMPSSHKVPFEFHISNDPPEKPLEATVPTQHQLPTCSTSTSALHTNDTRIENANTSALATTTSVMPSTRPSGETKNDTFKKGAASNTASNLVKNSLLNELDYSPLSLNDLKSSSSTTNENKGSNAAKSKIGGNKATDVLTSEAPHKQNSNKVQKRKRDDDPDSFLDLSSSSGLSNDEGSNSDISLPDESTGDRKSTVTAGSAKPGTINPTIHPIKSGLTKSVMEGVSDELSEVEDVMDSHNTGNEHQFKKKIDQERRITTEAVQARDPVEASKLTGESKRPAVLSSKLGQEDDIVGAREKCQQPSVSIETLLTLLQVVDADVEVSFSPETLYRSPQCSLSMKEDIIGCADRGGSLEPYDPSAISMILLEELPRLVRTSPMGCLIPDKVFTSGGAAISAGQLRSVLEPSLVKLWNVLFHHMANLVENNVMSTDEVGGMFGPLLLSENSTWHKECQALLASLIGTSLEGGSNNSDIASPREAKSNAHIDEKSALTGDRHLDARDVPDDRQSITSSDSSTLGSTPPQKEESSTQPDALNRSLSPERTLSYEDNFEEEDIPLNETAAYRKLMSSAQSDAVDDISDILGESESKNHESEADDDVENTLARSISPPVTSPRRSPAHVKTQEKKKPARQRPKLTLFGGGAGSLGLSYGSEDLGDSWEGDESGKLSTSWKSDKTDRTESVESDISLTPPLSPDLTPAYVPSAIANSKTDRAGQVVNKPEQKPNVKPNLKPGFWNHSDSDSEVDLRLSTGGMDAQDDTDDFDFYG